MTLLVFSLPNDFVERSGCSDRCVQRGHPGQHGEPGDSVAAAPYTAADALVLGAHHQQAGAGQIEVRQLSLAGGVERHRLQARRLSVADGFTQ